VPLILCFLNIYKNNINTCKSIMESKAMLCIAILLEKGKGAMVVIREIFAVAEEYPD
jgi:hypothetical protein